MCYGRALYSKRATVSEKYFDRNGSVMHTMTEYMDETSSTTPRIKRKRRNSDDYV